MNAKILNRNQSTPPADGWYQIEVCGEHPAGKDRVQVIDQKALDSIVNRFRAEAAAAGDDFAGMLVDEDHLSHDLDKSTAALAWLKELDIRNGELYGKLELTDLGEAAVAGKRFKFFSTEYPADALEDAGPGKVRPMRLGGLAMTNRPNNRGGRPIVNRGEQSPDLLKQELQQGTKESPADGGATKKTNMKTIAEKLGLPAEATEEQILAKIGEMQSKLDEAKTKEMDAEAEVILNRNAGRIPEGKRDDWKKAILANRADAEVLLAGLPERAAPQAPERIHNRATAKTPETVGDGNDSSKAQADLVAGIRNRERCTFERAWEIAKAEKPEMF